MRLALSHILGKQLAARVMRAIFWALLSASAFARGEATESSWLDSASAGMLDAEQGDGDLDDVKLITLLAPTKPDSSDTRSGELAMAGLRKGLETS